MCSERKRMRSSVCKMYVFEARALVAEGCMLRVDGNAIPVCNAKTTTRRTAIRFGRKKTKNITSIKK